MGVCVWLVSENMWCVQDICIQHMFTSLSDEDVSDVQISYICIPQPNVNLGVSTVPISVVSHMTDDKRKNR